MPDAETRTELAEVARALLAEVRAVRAEYEQLDAALAEVEQASGGGAGESAGGREAARIVAAELLRAGHSREDVEAYLRRTFGVEPDAQLLDGVIAAER
jgi:hypothetical protein